MTTEATSQATQSKDPLVLWAGQVTSAPKIQPTTKGDLVKLSIGIKTGYDQADGFRFVDLASWNPGLSQWILNNIYKGAKVAVEGFYSTREWEGKTYEQISVIQLGLVEYGQRSKKDEQVAELVDKAAPAATAEAVW